VAGARVSSGQPLVGRCAEYPLDPLRSMKAQYVGLSHVHLRQQLAPRIWYAGSLCHLCGLCGTIGTGFQ
jgi:DNA repair exonuclease SbcCD nuclease subunit